MKARTISTRTRHSSFCNSLALAATFALGASVAHAATWQWDGGAGTSNWQTANNWNPNAANTEFNGTFASRLNVNASQKLVYSAAEGSTTYSGVSGRGLVIGSGSLGSGTMEITGGTFTTTGSASDVISNQDSATGRLIINGGTYIGTSNGTGIGIGAGTSRTGILDVLAGTARIANLNMNTNSATANLNGGTLEVNTITRTGGTGTLNLNGGTLKARQDSTAFVTGLSAVNVNSGGAIIDSATFNITIGNILRDGGGGGGLTKNSAGTLTLTAAGAYTGSTTISGGTLQLGDGTTDGSISTSSSILNNSALAYNVVGTHSYTNVISGTGSVSKAGAGSITLTNTNTYQGATSVTGGIFALTGTGSINNSSGITLNGSGVKFNASSSVAVSPTVTLTNGTLTGSGTVNTVNVGAGTGGIITNNNGVAGAAFNIGALTLAGGANITLYSNGADTTSVLNVTTLTNNSALNAVTLTANNALGWTNGATYTIIDYGTLGGSGLFNFSTVANNLSGRQIGTFSDTGSAITLGITGDSVFWTGDTNALWNTTDTNWELLAGASATQFIALDDVIFDDNANGNTTIDIDAAPVATNTVIFNNTTGTSYTINSSGGHGITAGSVTKNNTGTVTISTANSYTGPTIINNGILRATTSASALGAGSLTLTGGQLQLANDTGLNFGRNTTVSGNTQITSDTLTSTAGVTHTLGTLVIGANTLTIAKGANATGSTAGVTFGTTTLTGASTFSIGANTTLTLGTVSNGAHTATITGAGTFVQTGVWGGGSGGITFDSGFSGTTTLNQANSYTGITTISGGTVKAGNANALGTTANGTVVNTGGTFDFNGIQLALGEAFTLAGGKLTNTGAEQLNAIRGDTVVTVDSQIGGTTRWDFRATGSSLTVNSGIKLTKVDANTVGMVGRTLVNDGVIEINEGVFALHTGGSYGGTGTYTVNANGELQMGQYGVGAAMSLANNILSNGGTISSANSAGNTPTWTGQLTLAATTSTKLKATGAGIYSGNIIGDGGLEKTDASSFTLSGTNSYIGATQVTAGTLILNGSLGSTAISVASGATFTQGTGGSIGGSASLTTSGTTTLAGTNTYSGTTTVNAGELRVSNASGLGNTSAIAVNAGRLSLDGGIVTGSGKSVTIKGDGSNFFGALQGNSGTNEWQGNVTVDSSGTRIGVNGGQLTVSGVIDSGANTYGVTFRSNAATVLILSGANTYLGDTGIVTGSGNVRLSGGADRLPTGTKLVFGSGATSGILDLNGQNQQVAGLSVVGGSNNEIKSTGAATLTVNAATASTWAGIVTGATALTKTGADTLTLTNTNTYSGNTTVSAGTLALTGTGSIANSANLKVDGTLDVSGITAGTFTVGTSQTLSGDGTVNATGKTLSIAGTHAVGNSPGQQDITGDVSYASTSTFEWDLDANVDGTGSRGVDFDAVDITGDLTIDVAATFKVIQNAGVNFANAFWDSNQTWTNIWNVGGTITSGWSNLAVSVYNTSNVLQDVSTEGYFTINNTTLTWTAVPELSNVLIGGLLGVGLLRRRRKQA